MNRQRAITFRKNHDPKAHSGTYHPFCLCSSTDESGWANDAIEEYGLGLAYQGKPVKGARQVQGRSYNNDGSRIYIVNLKHPSVTLNMIATIQLSHTDPIAYYEISTNYTNGAIFSEYVRERDMEPYVKWDIMDRHSSHKAVAANEKVGEIPVPESFAMKNIEPDFTPAGMSQMDPIESLFSFVDRHVENESGKYNKGDGWDADDLCKVLEEALHSVTFENVRSWYCRTWGVLYPQRPLPVYLRPDTSHVQFEREVKRIREEMGSEEEPVVTTRSGRVSRPGQF